MGVKCLMRGVQRPGCSAGNKNRRGPCFMLYILLISYSTASGDKSGVKEGRVMVYHMVDEFQ